MNCRAPPLEVQKKRCKEGEFGKWLPEHMFPTESGSFYRADKLQHGQRGAGSIENSSVIERVEIPLEHIVFFSGQRSG